MDISLGKEEYKCQRKACVGFEGIIRIRPGMEQINTKVFKLGSRICKNDSLVRAEKN